MKPGYSVLLANAWKLWDRIKVGTECWLWSASLDDDGYGQFQFRHEGVKYKIGAHVAAYTVTAGSLVDGVILRHTCDVRACCRTKHLLPGTHQDNVRDRDQRNRQAKGSNNGRSVLVESDVLEIRRLLVTAAPITIARQFGVDLGVVRGIRDGRIWTHVE